MMGRKTVVIRHGGPLDPRWFACHPNSYQNALASKANGWRSREDAAKHLEDMGYKIEYHDFDQMQKH